MCQNVAVAQKIEQKGIIVRWYTCMLYSGIIYRIYNGADMVSKL